MRKAASARDLARVAGVAAAVGTAVGAAGGRLLGRKASASRHEGDASREKEPGGERYGSIRKDPLRDAAALEQKPPTPAADEAKVAESAAPTGIKAVIARFDGYQQRHSWLGFPYAVVKKFGDDQAGNLAALIAYYGFLSLFPLLLALVTLLGFLLQGNPDLQDRVLTSTLGTFPVIGDQLRDNVHSLDGNGLVLAFGIAGSVYGGLGVTKAAQTALNEVWEVPKMARPNFLKALLRSLLLLVVVGGGILSTTMLTGIGSGSGALGAGLRVAAIAGSLVVNVGLFALAFRVLTARDVAWRDLFPGAVVAAIAWQVLQALGGYYVGHQLKGASDTYGLFAVVIGLLSWLYLEAQVVLLAAEVNVVRAGRLWPRSVAEPKLTRADKRAFRAYAQVEERRPEVDVDVDFEERRATC